MGNHIDDGELLPLDIEFAPLFRAQKLQLRNRIVWHFGHGLHTKRRFSGRYEVVMWYTKTKDYVFNLDAVRIPAKYPGKRHFKGPKAGELSGNPLGKNPEDVWFIPNCKSNHVEKTEHPCQFPVGLIERLILALSDPAPPCSILLLEWHPLASRPRSISGDFWGARSRRNTLRLVRTGSLSALTGAIKYRPHDKAIYDHTQSNLSHKPLEWS